MDTKIGILDLKNDAERALSIHSYFSALSLSFALVSECANKCYPDDWFVKYADSCIYLKEHFPNYFKKGKYKNKNHDKERFIMWIDGLQKTDREYEDEEKKGFPVINGELLYQFRCCLLHEGSANIDFKGKISDSNNQNIRRFIIYDNSTLKNVYGTGIFINSNGNRIIEVNISGLVNFLLHLVEVYYKKNKGKNFNEIIFEDRPVTKVDAGWRDIFYSKNNIDELKEK